MFKPETKILFQEPTADTRLLRVSTVTESSDVSFTVQFEGCPMALDEGQELLAYFHSDREFMQQVVRVIEIVDSGENLVLDLEVVADPISAEYRADYRAVTISADLFAALGEDRDLTVQDVSATGFAVLSNAEYLIGCQLAVSISYEEDIYSGMVSVQSIREFSSGRIRYGLRALEEDDLRDGLQQISLGVQRDQLKRQSGRG